MEIVDRRARAWIALVALPSLLACERGQQAHASPGELESSETMAHHFEQSVRARDAVVRGEIEEVRSAARALARARAGGELSPRHVDAMRTAARELAAATDVDRAGLALAGVALTCGACHAETGARIEAPETLPPEGDDVRARMALHLWAADRLWDGLVLPDDERFVAGAAAMVDAPLFPASGATPQQVAPEVRAVGDRVRAIATRARDARRDRDRARAYGELLGTCADCHRYVGVRGPAAPVEL